MSTIETIWATGRGNPAESPQSGTVKFFDPDRGFGFITADAPSVGDVFVHVSALPNREPVEKGDRVEFRATQSARGPAAVDVRLIERGA